VVLLAENYNDKGEWKDTSGNGNHATCVKNSDEDYECSGNLSKNLDRNGIKFNSWAYFRFRDIKIEYMISRVSSSSWSVSMWVRGIQRGRLLSRQGEAGNIVIPSKYSNGELLFGGYTFSIIPKQINTSTWTNIQGICNGSYVTTYINGISMRSTQMLNVYGDGEYETPDLPYYIGQGLIGEIGEIKIFKRELTQSEITSEYNTSLKKYNASLHPYSDDYYKYNEYNE